MIGLGTRDNTGGGKGPRGRGCSGGFTLVELLVVIVVIGILSGMVLGALNAASQTTKESKTRSTVEKLHRVIMRKYQDYRTRRVPFDTTGLDPRNAARRKLFALRDMMRMELPDRWSDVTDGPIISGIPQPALSQRYYRAYQRAMTAAGGDSEKVQAVNDNAAAECLYLIVMNSPEDAELFQSNEIGDTDGDGLKEFIDAWGHPIRFLRWPAGFVPNPASDPGNAADSDYQSGDPTTDHDPFDSRNMDQTAYLLIPLIYSAGPDAIYDINIGKTADNQVFSYHAHGNPYPYVTDDNGTGHLIGVPLDGDAIDGSPPNGSLDHLDNIHNHRR